MIHFNIPAKTGTEERHIADMLSGTRLTAGKYHAMCREWFKKKLGKEVLLTPSCTDALEMVACLLDIAPGDEVIMPSYTFVSTANAFVIHGAVPVFVDIRPDTMNIDEKLIENAITPRTRAIVVMHYAGVACDMDYINELAKRHNIPVVEDAAHGVFAKWKGQYLGTLGAFGAFSFHETKNITAGEGGGLIINDEAYAQSADIMQYKGTDRTAFLQGRVKQYSWVGKGSSWAMGELAAAYLYGNLESADAIMDKRRALWSRYYEALLPLEEKALLDLPHIPDQCEGNGHIFYVKLRDRTQRDDFIAKLHNGGVGTAFHYVPLHSSPAGQKYARFAGEDRYTTRESERLVRLPLYYALTFEDIDKVASVIFDYFQQAS